MGAVGNSRKLDRLARVTLNNTLTSGITKADASKPISEILDFIVQDREVMLYLRVNTLRKAIAGDAALAFGEKVFSYPSGLGVIQPLYTTVRVSSLTPTGLSATAGEVGLGTTIASGAVATLGGTPAFENVMEGTTIGNHVAGTTLTSKLGNCAVAFGDHGAAGNFGVVDATAAEAGVHLNIASTWDQTAAESVAFSATIVHRFRILSSDFGVL